MAASPQQVFARRRYLVLRGIVANPLLGFLWRHVAARDAHGALQSASGEVTRAGGAYGDTVMEHLLERLRPRVETETGLALHPTYSYVRLYKTGDALAPHHDRPACEISLSLNLGQEPPAPWPLWIAGTDGRPSAVRLEPGDALLYRGVECRHWREPFPGHQLAQVFLHYVDADGPYSAWRFDKRESLAMSPRLPI